MQAYEMIIGLEVHVALLTEKKLFCGCSAAFGAPPNTQGCPVCTGGPGAMPQLNREAVALAIRAGVALGGRIQALSYFDRKHYAAPDLPKGYQITQGDQPFCLDAGLTVQGAGGRGPIAIPRIHIEEDAGRQLQAGGETIIDFNRSGIPLIEIVTAPDFRDGEEVRTFLQALRGILVAAGVTDGRMNEGSLRVDVNLSIRAQGETAPGPRVEIKNLNSFAYAVRAIRSEYERQVAARLAGETIRGETLRFEPKLGRNIPMRQKGDAAGYAFEREPNLPPLSIAQADIQAAKASLPELPPERQLRYQAQYGLSPVEAGALSAPMAIGDAFEGAAALAKSPKTLARLLVGDLPRLFGQEGEMTIRPRDIARLSDMVADGHIHHGAAREVLSQMMATGQSPDGLADSMGLALIGDGETLRRWATQVIANNQAMARQYLQGKAGVLDALMGRLMGLSGGRAHPAKARDMLLEALSAKMKKTP